MAKSSFAKDIERIQEILTTMEHLGGNDPSSAKPWLALQDELEMRMNDNAEEFLALARLAKRMRNHVSVSSRDENGIYYPLYVDDEIEAAAKEYDKLLGASDET